MYQRDGRGGEMRRVEYESDETMEVLSLEDWLYRTGGKNLVLAHPTFFLHPGLVYWDLTLAIEEWSLKVTCFAKPLFRCKVVSQKVTHGL